LLALILPLFLRGGQGGVKNLTEGREKLKTNESCREWLKTKGKVGRG
jgi:hypothetical protein